MSEAWIPVVAVAAMVFGLWIGDWRGRRPKASKKAEWAELPVGPPPAKTWDELQNATYETTVPLTIAATTPVADVLDVLPQLMADRVRLDVAMQGPVLIAPGHYTVHLQCVARFKKHTEPFR